MKLHETDTLNVTTATGIPGRITGYELQSAVSSTMASIRAWFREIVIFPVFMLTCIVLKAQAFVHPGILHSSDDLDRMKHAVAARLEPIYAGYLLYIQNPVSHFSYQMLGPMPMVGRNPTTGQVAYDSDANAAHHNAVMWAITGDKRYAAKAIEIVNAWSATLTSITGKDAVLMAGLGPFKMINAAEILRYTGSGWKETDIRRAEQHFKEVIYPVLKDFAPFANGNWDAAAMKTMMAVAVFCNDRPMFERALRYYVNGHGNGSLDHYIVSEDGQVQESGRDQAHTQLGIAMLAECCAIARNQGLDLYAYRNNRLLKGFEYTAKFNLGNEVPFTEWLDRTGKYHHRKISQQARGELRAVYEQVFNHYAGQPGSTVLYTGQAVSKIRPEGPGKPGADHPGYGTLYFASKQRTAVKGPPAPPAAIVVMSSGDSTRLDWIEPIGAVSYTIKRAAGSGGPYSVIASGIRQPAFTDHSLHRGVTYYYTVIASSKDGVSAEGYAAAASAGLPNPWKQQEIGNVNGTSSSDGRIFTMEAGRADRGNSTDGFHFLYQQSTGDSGITARFIPQTNSQFTRMGLMMRGGTDDHTAVVSLLLLPARTQDIEVPHWCVQIVTGDAMPAVADSNAVSFPVSAPAVTWGRLTGEAWLRLERKGNKFTGSFSYDGKGWTQLHATVELALNKKILTGVAVSSGMPNSTTAFFDHVLIQKSK